MTHKRLRFGALVVIANACAASVLMYSTPALAADCSPKNICLPFSDCTPALALNFCTNATPSGCSLVSAMCLGFCGLAGRNIHCTYQ